MRVCMVSPHLPPMQAAVALLPVILGDTLSSNDVTASYVSHPAEGGWPEHRSEVAYVPRRGRDPLSRSWLGAVAAGAAGGAGAARIRAAVGGWARWRRARGGPGGREP